MKYINKDIKSVYPLIIKKGNDTIRNYYKATTTGGIYFKESFNYLESTGNGIKLHNHGIEIGCDYDLVSKFEDYINIGSNGNLQSILELFSKNHPIIKWFLKTLIKDGISPYDEIVGFGIYQYREKSSYIAYSMDFKRFGRLTLVACDYDYDYIIHLKRRGQCFYYSTLRSSAIVNKFLIKIKCIRNLLYRIEGEETAEVIKKLRDTENV